MIVRGRTVAGAWFWSATDSRYWNIFRESSHDSGREPLRHHLEQNLGELGSVDRSDQLPDGRLHGSNLEAPAQNRRCGQDTARFRQSSEIPKHCRRPKPMSSYQKAGLRAAPHSTTWGIGFHFRTSRCMRNNSTAAGRNRNWFPTRMKFKSLRDAQRRIVFGAKPVRSAS